MPFRPTKWVLYAPIAVLPFLASVVLEGRNVQGTLAQAVSARLSAAGSDWAKAEVQGRDAVLTGDAPSPEQLDAAVAAVVGTYGIRRVESFARVVEGPPAAPPVKPLSGLPGELRGAGTWPEGNGNWSLGLNGPLQPVKHDVAATLTSRSGLAAIESLVTRNAAPVPSGLLVLAAVAGPPPVTAAPAGTAAETAANEAPLKQMRAPTVLPYSGVETPSSIMGTWDEGVARDLFVAITDTGTRTALGSDAALTSDGVGDWTLALDGKLAPGIYDVVVETVDEAGNRIKDATSAEIYIKPQPPPMNMPVVNAVSGDTSPAAITGTWDEAAATALFVAIAGTEIRTALGSDAALSSDGKGNWKLALQQPLPPGQYDVVVETRDDLGRSAIDQSSGEIEIAAPPPPPMKAPTVNSYSGDTSPALITGTWDEGTAQDLFVAIADTEIRTALRSDVELMSNGRGQWELSVNRKLAPGAYDVVVETVDASGNRARDTTSAEIYIKAPPPEPAVDCEAQFQAIIQKGHIRFAFNHIGVAEEDQAVVSDVAKLLTNEHCLDRRLEITGHADYFGEKAYNQWLSVRRAEIVAAALAAAGVKAERLTANGLGETSPEIGDRSRDARAANRRVILTMSR